MRNKTERYIQKQNGVNVIKNFFTSKAFIFTAVAVVLALVMGGLYIWYSNNYGNSTKIVLADRNYVDYEWQEEAASCGITGDYVWSRTKQTLITAQSDGQLIMSAMTIKGRLTAQTEELSNEYLLADQAQLLKIYVLNNDRVSASSLKAHIVEEFQTESGLYRTRVCDENTDEVSVRDNMEFLEAMMEYYVAFGKASDYEIIENLTDALFDEEGNLVEEDLSVVSYQGASYIATDDNQEESEGETETFRGCRLSSIKLRLISDLEQNGLVPSGTYDKYLNIVLDGRISDDLPLYAYGYTVEDGNINYLYRYDSDTAVNSVEAVKVMRNLSEVSALPDDSYAWLKAAVYNDGCIYSNYAIIGGAGSDEEDFGVYFDVLFIAINREDIDLYSKVSSIIGENIATKTSSPVLSMVFRQNGTRFEVRASDNLALYAAVI